MANSARFLCIVKNFKTFLTGWEGSEPLLREDFGNLIRVALGMDPFTHACLQMFEFFSSQFRLHRVDLLESGIPGRGRTPPVVSSSEDGGDLFPRRRRRRPGQARPLEEEEDDHHETAGENPAPAEDGDEDEGQSGGPQQVRSHARHQGGPSGAARKTGLFPPQPETGRAPPPPPPPPNETEAASEEGKSKAPTVGPLRPGQAISTTTVKVDGGHSAAASTSRMTQNAESGAGQQQKTSLSQTPPPVPAAAVITTTAAAPPPPPAAAAAAAAAGSERPEVETEAAVAAHLSLLSSFDERVRERRYDMKPCSYISCSFFFTLSSRKKNIARPLQRLPKMDKR